MQLLYARNIELASTAAEAVTLLAQNSNSNTITPSPPAAAAAGSALGSLTPAAVQGLGELVKEGAAHAYALGLGRRSGSSSSTVVQQQQQQSAADHPGSSRRSFSSVPGGSDMLRPIPEAGSLNGSSTVDSLADAAEAAGVAWSAQRQQQQALHSTSSIVMQHPSLNRASLPGSGLTPSGTLQQQAAALAASLLNAAPQRGGGSAAAAAAALTSRQRPRVSSSGNATLQCLVCAHVGHDCCGACPLSAALTALRLLLVPQPELQGLLVGSGVLQVLVGLAAGEAGGIQHGKLLGALAGLLAVAVTGNSAAQDQVRAC
jgi:hypothetical protein